MVTREDSSYPLLLVSRFVEVTRTWFEDGIVHRGVRLEYRYFAVERPSVTQTAMLEDHLRPSVVGMEMKRLEERP